MFSHTAPRSTSHSDDDRLSATLETADPAVESIIRYIERRCFGRVHRLDVERLADRFVVYGSTRSYYAKQLAQHAALEAAAGCPVDNQIEVTRD